HHRPARVLGAHLPRGQEGDEGALPAAPLARRPLDGARHPPRQATRYLSSRSRRGRAHVASTEAWPHWRSLQPPQARPMTRLETIPHRAMDLASNAVGSLRQHMPSRAGTLLQTGMTLGALKTGARVAGKFARRNPAILAATVAGAGILWYA